MKKTLMTIAALLLSAQSALAVQPGWYQASNSPEFSALVLEDQIGGRAVQTIELYDELNPHKARSARYVFQPLEGNSFSVEAGTFQLLHSGREDLIPAQYRVPF